MHQLSDYQYFLPKELIAQQPLPNRSDSRLMVVQGNRLLHTEFSALPLQLNPGDHLIFNDTRVVPARIYGEKQSGGKLELMLERVTPSGTVLAKIRCSKSPKPGSLVRIKSKPDDSGNTSVLPVKVLGREQDLFELKELDTASVSLSQFIDTYGEIPLPPYISRAPSETDKERYQTVFAKAPGAVAAPTAGLHFDDELLAALGSNGVRQSTITLHVGAGTFMPVRVDDLSRHVMHAERVHVSADTVESINKTKSEGGRIIAVGTTCVRSLEAAARQTGELKPFDGETQLFLTPGSQFRVVDGMITNFHLPESTLLMLVAAFAGFENTMKAYQQAVAEHYRFFSYGDAMLVWPQDNEYVENAL